jgi:ABC-2 type transport system permease protein
MNLGNMGIIARKELRDLFMNKGTWISALLFALLFMITNLGSVPPAGPDGLTVVDWPIIYLSLFVGVFCAFVLCGSVFFREKQSGVVETLLCTPLDLRSIWLGKVAGVAVPAYLLGLLSAAGLFLSTKMVIGSIAALSPIAWVHLIVVCPLFILAATGLIGYVQLAMGMKENRLISMGVFLLLIVGLSLSSGLVQEDPGMMGQVVLGLLAFGLVLFSISFGLSKRLNKERIVTSIPD